METCSCESGESVANSCEYKVKRAGFCWGIGRELYDAPNISFKLMDDEYTEKQGKIACYAKFRVAEMEYDRERGEFIKFTVVDKNGNVRFRLNSVPHAQKQGTEQRNTAANTNVAQDSRTRHRRNQSLQSTSERTKVKTACTS